MTYAYARWLSHAFSEPFMRPKTLCIIINQFISVLIFKLHSAYHESFIHIFNPAPLSSKYILLKDSAIYMDNKCIIYNTYQCSQGLIGKYMPAKGSSAWLNILANEAFAKEFRLARV